MKTTMNQKIALVAAMVGITLASPTFAAGTLIDFESGFVDMQAVSSIVTADNTVTFSVGTSYAGSSNAYIAGVGDPVTAFVPHDSLDPSFGQRAGRFFLTDEVAGPSTKYNYYIVFNRAVQYLSLDLYDYRVDGGPNYGDSAILTAYSDLFGTVVDTDTFTIQRPNPLDANAENLMVNGGTPIQAVALTFSAGDVGTGIDNINFATVPAPGAFVLVGIGSSLVGWMRRRRMA